MKGLIFDIRSFSVHDGPGIRTTVFLKGCPLRCTWCHNPESQSDVEEKIHNQKKVGDKIFRNETLAGTWMNVTEVLDVVQNDIPFMEESGGGLTLSGGEPIMQADFILELLKAAKNLNIHTAIDTCGFAEFASFEKIIPFTDLYLYDLKLADDSDHKKYTGESNRLILENLKLISQFGKKIIIRIPLIPEITDTHDNLGKLRTIIEHTAGVQRIDLLPYHVAGLKKYERLGIKPPYENLTIYSKAKSEEIKEFFIHSAPIVSIGA